MKQTNPYITLGIAYNSTLDEVKSAYKSLAMQHHPDRGGSATKFQEITQAYELIKSGVHIPKPTKTTQRVNFPVTILQQIQGIDDYIELSNGDLAKISVPPGISVNDKLRVSSDTVDYVITFTEQPDSVFTRLDHDVILYKELELTTALLGGILEVQDPEGNQITINIKPGTGNQTLTVANKGLYNRTNKKRGMLCVITTVKIPALTTEEELQEFTIRLNNERNRTGS